jgi:hypothetical protein
MIGNGTMEFMFIRSFEVAICFCTSSCLGGVQHLRTTKDKAIVQKCVKEGVPRKNYQLHALSNNKIDRVLEKVKDHYMDIRRGQPRRMTRKETYYKLYAS